MTNYGASRVLRHKARVDIMKFFTKKIKIENIKLKDKYKTKNSTTKNKK